MTVRRRSRCCSRRSRRRDRWMLGPTEKRPRRPGPEPRAASFHWQWRAGCVSPRSLLLRETPGAYAPGSPTTSYTRLRTCVIFSSRRAWRPPSNFVSSHVCTMPLHQSLADQVGRQAQHVGVVVSAAHLGVDQVAAVGGPHAVHLVRGDAHAVAGGADEDAAIGLTAGHRLGDRDGDSPGSRRWPALVGPEVATLWPRSCEQGARGVAWLPRRGGRCRRRFSCPSHSEMSRSTWWTMMSAHAR